MIGILIALVGILGSYALGFFVASRWSPWSGKTDVLFFPDDKKPCRSFFNNLSGNGNPDCFHPKCNYAHFKAGETTSFMQIVLTLHKAKRNIDLCVYDFTQIELKRILIAARKNGVSVRIITDAHPDRQQEAIQAEEGAVEVELKVKSVGRSRSKSPATNQPDHEQQTKKKKHHHQQHQPQVPRSAQSPQFQQQQQYNPDQIPRLQKAGIPIKMNRTSGEARAGKMHNKFVIVDNECLMTGSFNWTHSAIVKNDEAVIRTRERQVVDQFIIKFNQLWEQLEERSDKAPFLQRAG